MSQTPLLEAENLTIKYRTSDGPLTAVSDASFTIDEKEFFGLIGESGCGKSTLAKAIIGGLDDNGEITSGKLIFKGEDIHELSDRELNKKIRWKEISMIPQASMNSLDPIRRVKNQAVELAENHDAMDREATIDRLQELFESVGLSPERISDYPTQFSGGMKQRAVIAFSLLLKPSLIIADEPTTALDVIMQDQVLEHIENLDEQFNTSVLLITHDISVVMETCSRTGVMHSGQLAEVGQTTSLHSSPRHPYTILLQRAFPDIRYPDRKLEEIEGYPPETVGEVNYCTFADRCPWAIDECEERSPPLESVNGDGGHRAACIRKDEIESEVD